MQPLDHEGLITSFNAKFLWGGGEGGRGRGGAIRMLGFSFKDKELCLFVV